MSAADRPRSPRDRPLGLAPTGTSATFVFGLLYPLFGLSFFVVALSPWLGGGTGTGVLHWAENGLYLMLALASLTVFGSVPYVLSYLDRRYMAVCIFFALGLFSAVAVPAAVLTLVILLVVSIGHEPGLVGLTFFFGTCLLVMLATWPWLVRGLRLRYWQPWTTPDQWEVGDERLARWAQDATGVEDRRPATDGSRPPRRRPR